MFALLAFTISSVPIHAQPDIQNDTAVEELTELPSQIYGDVKDAIVAIAEGIGTTTEYVYPILVKQQFVKSVSHTLVLSIMLFFALGFFLCARLSGNKNLKGEEFFYQMSGISLLAFFILICFNIGTISTGFFNPEYGAIKEITRLVTGN